MLAATADGPTISALASPLTGPERHFCPFIPLPAWLLAATALMETSYKEAAKLCTVTIQAICNFDTCATSSSLMKAVTMTQDEENDATRDLSTLSLIHI